MPAKKKKLLIIRYAAYGDMLIVSPIIRLYHKKGYKVDVETKPSGKVILKHNPFVNKIILHKEELDEKELKKHYKKIGKGYDKVINLNGSIEGELVLVPWQKEYHLSQEERKELCDKNYYEETMRLAKLSFIPGLTGEIYLTPYEMEKARKSYSKYRKKFIVLWGLSGSSVHKAWPYTEHVAKAFLDAHEDVVIFTAGDIMCQLLEFDHPRVHKKSGNWGIRQSIAMASLSDLVIGTDTGFSHGAGIWRTPQILLLSAQSKENISKHFRNCQTLTADVPCYPCYKLHYGLETCELNKNRLPVCMAELKPAKVLNVMEDIYQEWRIQNGLRDGDRREAAVY